MKYFVTGGAGFIGSNLIDRLLKRGDEVVCYDNLSTGQERFLEGARESENFAFIKGDVLNQEKLGIAMDGCDFVFHLAANADVRFGIENTGRDLQQNTIATYNVLEAMRENDIKKIAFSSTGSIYGESKVIPTPEDSPFPVQTSLYGASKLAGEGLIAAFCEGFEFQSWIFRFVSILGERYTHGHVYDFYKKLKEDPERMEILGNGKQKKSYLYIQDCINAIFFAIENATEKVNIFNLGTKEYCMVNDSVGWICKELGLSPELEYTGGERGWIGDNPFIFLDTKKINDLGWEPELNIEKSIIKTLNYLKQNEWVFEARKV